MEPKTFTKEFQLEFLDMDVEDKEAQAAVSVNPLYNWVKFILTDNKPNENKQRIPTEEFDNLIKTGYFAPLKMAAKIIEEGHDNAIPLGVITHLKKVEDQIRCMAALWSRERPEDVEIIKQAYAERKPLNVSWEITYSDSKTNEDGIEDLLGTSLRAATIVGLPAYSGRTPIYAVASKDSSSKEDILNEEEIKALKDELTEAKAKVTDLENKLAEAAKQLEELSALKEFKASVEKKEEEVTKLASIKTKFADAGLEKDEEYFNTHKEMLLGLSPEALDFMIQEMVAFASASGKVATSSKVPPINSTGEGLKTPQEIGKALREQLKK